MSSASKRIRMLNTRKILFNNQICLLQSVPSESRCFRILSIRKTLFCIHILLLRSFSHFERFLTADQPLLLDNYCKASAPQNHSPLRHLEFRVSQTPCDLFWRLSLCASVNQTLSETVAKYSKVAPTQAGPTKSPLEFSSLPHRTSYEIRKELK